MPGLHLDKWDRAVHAGLGGEADLEGIPPVAVVQDEIWLTPNRAREALDWSVTPGDPALIYTEICVGPG